MSRSKDYDSDFYYTIEQGSRTSAAALAPVLIDVIGKFESLVDFGCGTGIWLEQFRRHGVSNVLGLDFGHGSKYNLVIPENFYLQKNLAKKIEVGKFDACLCLEVAEHIESTHEDVFIENLVRSANKVIFSAAVPYQLGHHHVNEQPPNHWIKKFDSHDFVCHDVLRPLIWDVADISWWYRQNVMLFVSRQLCDVNASLSSLSTFQGAHLIHPEAFRFRNIWLNSVLEKK